MTLPPFIRETAQGSTLEVYVQPRASKNELIGIHEGTLKVRLSSPPVEGEANRECLRFLAKALDVPKSLLQIVQGKKSRRKKILIPGISGEYLHNRLKQIGVIC
jgi:uncharacterized protein